MGSSVKAKGKATLEGEAIRDHRRYKHAEVMDPKLWRNLPKELVDLVFSHVTARDITALRLVSKGWKSALSTNPNFQNLCQQASSNMFAIMSWNDSKTNFAYYIFDYNSNMWRSSLCSKFTSSMPSSYRESTIVHGGGLVCFVPEQQLNAIAQESFPIVVYNPLTSAWRELPLQSLYRKAIVMSQLVTNYQDNTSYKLMIVCSLQGIFEAECYDSSTGIWSKMHEGFICGPYRSLFHEFEFVKDLCTFDSAQGTFTDMTSLGPLVLSECDVCRSYLLQDRAFLLKRNQESGQIVQVLNESGEADDRDVGIHCHGSEYKLVEFQVADTSNRLELKARRSYIFPPHPFQEDICDLDFLVCGNFILVISAITMDASYHELDWLYDMSKDVWRVLPSLPANSRRIDGGKRICELRWDAIP